jgi:hypothetical protein
LTSATSPDFETVLQQRAQHSFIKDRRVVLTVSRKLSSNHLAWVLSASTAKVTKVQLLCHRIIPSQRSGWQTEISSTCWVPNSNIFRKNVRFSIWADLKIQRWVCLVGTSPVGVLACCQALGSGPGSRGRARPM